MAGAMTHAKYQQSQASKTPRRQTTCPGRAPGLLGDLLALQRSLGNQAVGRLLGQRAGSASSEGEAPAPASVNRALSGSGMPLDLESRRDMESRFGRDFSGVRLHTDARASESARALNAAAYTVKQDIVFDSEKYAPGVPSGRRLLAHELAHVVQQTGSPGKSSLKVGRPGDAAEREAERAAVAVVAGRPARIVPGSQPVAVHRQTAGQGAVASNVDAEPRVRQWLQQHQFAPPESQPKDGERHVLLNGKDMTLSDGVKLAAEDLKLPAEVVKGVIVAELAGPRPFPGLLRNAPIVGPGNLVPGIPSTQLGLTSTGGINPAIGKMIDLQTIDEWLEAHNFDVPKIRDPLGAKVLLDGQEMTIEQVAGRAMAVVGGGGEIKVAFVTRKEILEHLRQKYYAKTQEPGNQIVLGYTLVPKALQAATGVDPNNPLRTQHQFSFTITLAHHPDDAAGRETSFQGSIAFNDKGDIVNIQAGAQEAIVAPLFKGWIQVSGFVQGMVSANWSKSASGTATISPAFQAAVGGQVLVTPNIKAGAFRFLTGRVQIGAQAMGTVQFSSEPVQVGVTGGLVLNIPFSL